MPTQEEDKGEDEGNGEVSKMSGQKSLQPSFSSLKPAVGFVESGNVIFPVSSLVRIVASMLTLARGG